MIFDDDDFPEGFTGRGNWNELEDNLRLFYLPHNSKNHRINTTWLGFTNAHDDGLTWKERVKANRKDPELRKALAARDKIYQKRYMEKINKDPEKVAKRRARARAYYAAKKSATSQARSLPGIGAASLRLP